MNSQITRDADRLRAIAGEKPVETFWLTEDPLTGEKFDVPAPAETREPVLAEAA